MHVFEHFEKTQLKKIIRNYNLHVKIARYSKLDKDELIAHMKNYLFINNEGRIMVKDEVLNKADDEMNKVEVKKVKEPKAKKEPKKKEPKEKPAKKEEPKKEEPKKEEPKKQETVADMTPRFLLRAYFLLLNCRTFQGVSQSKVNAERVAQDKKELEFLKNKYNFSKKEDIKPEIEKHMKMTNMKLKDWTTIYTPYEQEYKCFSKGYKKLHNYLIKLEEEERKPAPKKESPKPPAKAKKEPKPKPAKKEKPAPVPKK